MFALIFFVIYCLFAWRYFRFAVLFLIILLPAYLIRFNIGPLPTTLLELCFGAVFLVWLIKYARYDWLNIKNFIVRNKLFAIFIALFFIASIISIFVSDMVVASLGQWRAYFLEPMLFFAVLVGRMSVIPSGREKSVVSGRQTPLCSPLERGKGDCVSIVYLIWSLTFSTLSISIYSIIQKFTGWGIATAEWTNIATRRVTAFYTSPNAVTLFLVPVMMLVLCLLITKITNKKYKTFILIIFILSLLAIFFTKSQGAWVGLAVGFTVLVFLLGYKKIAMAAAVVGVIFALIMPSMRAAILFKDQAGQNRLALWGYSWNFLSKSPQNFVLGTGVRQFFRKVQKPYYDVKKMERLIYPHNIFLNFWTETGLLGMLSFAGILFFSFYFSIKTFFLDKKIGAILLASLIAFTIQGLVDVPYFKNDLSFLFWIILGVIYFQYENLRYSKTAGV